MFEYIKVNYEEIENYRKQYLEQLSELQELFLEWIVDKGNYYAINSNDKTIGYFIISKQNVLVEMYVNNKYINEITEIFNGIYNKFNINNILCKSFDYLLLKCCLDNNFKYKPVGHMFRDCIETVPQDVSEFTKINFADETDYEDLLKYDNDLYDTEEDLMFILKNRMVIKYYIEDKLIGCGFLIKVNKFYNHCDIGMWIDTPYRSKGYRHKNNIRFEAKRHKRR